MRTIKFRGRNRQGKWLYGDLLHRDNESYILPEDALDSMNNYLVIPDTVEQFTGLLDKNGKEIYEGDIMRVPPTECNNEITGVVEFDRCSYFIRSFLSGTCHSLAWTMRERMIGEPRSFIIGNIHDNPELSNSL